jgi:hypothetical protein
VKRPRPDLVGIDFQQIVQRGASEMMRQGHDSAEKRERAKRQYTYTDAPELAVLIFQERYDPPLWRMETLKPGPNGMGIVKVWDPNPAFLEAELRNVLAGKLEVYGVCANSEDARWSAANIKIREMGTVRLRDSQTREGETH